MEFHEKGLFREIWLLETAPIHGLSIRRICNMSARLRGQSRRGNVGAPITAQLPYPQMPCCQPQRYR